MKIGIIANCQSQTLTVLCRLMLHAPEIVMLDLSGPKSRDDVFQRDICDRMKDCDFVFVQPNNMDYANDERMRDACQGQIVKIANFFFRGLHPDMCMIGDFTNRAKVLSANHSLVILDAYLQGLSAQQAAESFNVDNYNRLGLFNAWESSLAEMRDRDTAVDFPAVDLIEESARRYPAFLTMNHPTVRLVYDYFETVFKRLSIKYDPVDVSRMSDPLGVHDITGLMDIVCEHHQLPYRTSETWRMNTLGHKFIKIPQLAEAFYESYEEAPSDILKVHSPVDMVNELRANPTLRFLVDAVPVPEMRTPLKRTYKPPHYVSREEFIAALTVEIGFAPLTSVQHPDFLPALKLLNGKHPFNTTERIWTWEECETKFKEGWDFISFTIKDRDDDYALAACAWISGNIIEQFVMNSRVMGRDAENKIIDWLGALMYKNGMTAVEGRLIQNKTNVPCWDMYQRCGFTKEIGLWHKSLSAPPPFSPSLESTENRIEMPRNVYPQENVELIDHPDQWYGGRTYAQHGDDLIILNIFRRLNIERPNYLDIGAHHPIVISNTALLYKYGSRGINVEANPNLMGEFHKYRPEDINLNVGVAIKPGTMKFYMYDDFSGRNSLMPETLADMGIRGEIDIPVVTIEDIVTKYANGIYPDLLTIDVEGMDQAILSTIGYQRSKPKVICTEIIAGKMSSEDGIRRLLIDKGYFPYCWAGSNMMFILKEYQAAMY